MDYGVYDIKDLSDDKIESLISQNQSFIINGFENKYRKNVVSTVVKVLKEKDLKYRIIQKGRFLAPFAAAGTAALPLTLNPVVPLALVAGAAAGAVAMGAQHIVTYKADYEIIKSSNEISLRYLKGKP